MRLIVFTIIFLLFSQSANCQDSNSKSGAFPTNMDTLLFNKLKNYNGEILAFDGQIKAIQNSRNNTPSYKLDLGNNKIL